MSEERSAVILYAVSHDLNIVKFILSPFSSGVIVEGFTQKKCFFYKNEWSQKSCLENFIVSRQLFILILSDYNSKREITSPPTTSPVS